MNKKICIIMCFLFFLLAGNVSALANAVTLSINPEHAAPGDSVTISGTADGNTPVTIKVIGSNEDIVFLNSVKSDASGNYSDTFTVPSDMPLGVLNVIAGSGENVAAAELNVAAQEKADCETIKGVTPVLESKTHTSVILTAVYGYEYVKTADGSDVLEATWQDGNEFAGLTAETNYDFYQRVKETTTHKASAVSDKLDVKTDAALSQNKEILSAKTIANIPVTTNDGRTLAQIKNDLGNTVVLIAEGNENKNVPVTWEDNTVPEYDNATARTYVLTGTIGQLPKGYKDETDTVTGVTVNIVVTNAQVNALTGRAVIVGNAVYGKTLTASLENGNNTGTLSYQWTREGANISEATGESYILVKEDIGNQIAVKISSSKETGTLTSIQTAAVEKADCETIKGVTPVLESKTRTSVILTAVYGYEYVKTADGSDISEATWQCGNEFIGLTAETNYDFYQRVKETATHKASAVSDKLDVKTDAAHSQNKEILSAKTIANIAVTTNDGKTLAQIKNDLGNTVVLIAEGDESVNVPVTWEDNTVPEYDNATARTYVLTGTIGQLPKGYKDETDTVTTVEVDIVVADEPVQAKEIISAKDIADVAVTTNDGKTLAQIKTDLGNTVVLIAEGNANVNVPVTWEDNTEPEYDNATARTYVLTGTIGQLPDGYKDETDPVTTVKIDIVVNSGQIQLPSDVIELDNDSVVDLGSGVQTPDLTQYTGGNLDKVDLTQPQNVGGKLVQVQKTVRLESATNNQPITITNTDAANVSVLIPDGTTILAPDGWDGTIAPPKVVSSAGTAPSGFSVGNTVIEVGSPNAVLLFDKPVILTLQGVTGPVGYKPAGSDTWVQITQLAGGTYDNPTAPAFPGEAYISNGIDTKIITYHFTSFAVLVTQTSPSIGGSSYSGDRLNTVTASGGNVTRYGAVVEIPANALTGNTRIKIQKVSSTSNLPVSSGSKFVGDVLDISKDKSGKFSKSVTITMTFDKSQVTDKETISIYWFDESTKKWVELDNVVVDLEAGTVSGQIDHFTKFGLIATEKAEEKLPIENSVVLTDISGHWAETGIKKLIESEAIKGYADGTFKPDRTISRAEFATVLVKAFNLEAKSGKVFSDTANHWAKDYIATAEACGIVNGYDANTFGTDDPITREQMAVMIVKAAKLEMVTGGKSFIDGSKTSNWAQDAVAIATTNNIISGYPDNTFRPKADTTRAEAVTVILKAIN